MQNAPSPIEEKHSDLIQSIRPLFDEASWPKVEEQLKVLDGCEMLRKDFQKLIQEIKVSSRPDQEAKNVQSLLEIGLADFKLAAAKRDLSLGGIYGSLNHFRVRLNNVLPDKKEENLEKILTIGLAAAKRNETEKSEHVGNVFDKLNHVVHFWGEIGRSNHSFSGEKTPELIAEVPEKARAILNLAVAAGSKAEEALKWLSDAWGSWPEKDSKDEGWALAVNTLAACDYNPPPAVEITSAIFNNALGSPEKAKILIGEMGDLGPKRSTIKVRHEQSENGPMFLIEPVK